MTGPPFFRPGMPIMARPVFSSTPVRIVPRDWLVRGYGEAHDRFLAASQHPDSPEGLYFPLLEALNWAGALEEQLRPHSDALLSAIRFVRNTVLHDWAEAVEGRNVENPQVVTQGRSGPLAPPVIYEWFWRDRQHLPSPQGRPRGGPVYDTLLSGKPVREALGQLRGIFR
jgi:hypothetical protein